MIIGSRAVLKTVVSKGIEGSSPSASARWYDFPAEAKSRLK